MRRRLRDSFLWDDRLDMLSGWGFVLGFLTMVAVIAVVVCVAVYAVESRNCAYAARQFGKQTHYDFFAKCYIRINAHQMVPLDQWRAFKESN